MSAKDTFHESVKRALQKEQWVITADPLKFKFGNVKFQVDLGAERLVAAERGGEKIAVEIKSFLNPSVITDFMLQRDNFSVIGLAWHRLNLIGNCIWQYQLTCIKHFFSLSSLKLRYNSIRC